MSSPTNLTVLQQIISGAKAEMAPDIPDDEFWEFFAATELLREFQLSPDDILSGLVGTSAEHEERAGSDGGIDAFYLFINGIPLRDLDEAKTVREKKGVILDVILIQATRSTGFELTPLNRLSNTCDSIFRIDLNPENFTESYNARLLDTIRRFRAAHATLLTRHPTINVSIYLAARANTQTINQTISGKAKELETKIKETLGTVTNCHFTFTGARELINLWNRPIKFDFVLKCSQSINDGKKGYIALVELGEYHRLITNEEGGLRDHLFESNVRDYEGSVSVNRQIRETLDARDGTASFWWLNNGITILAETVGGSPTELSLSDPQVVNGLQTSQVIWEYFRDSGANPQEDSRHAVIRILQPPNDAMQDRIIRATNSQTKIPPQYLRASEEIQRDIEILFRGEGLHYDRRKNSWRKTMTPISRVVGISELAQSVAAIVLGEADQARGRPSRYFKDKQYKRVFSKKLFPYYAVCAKLKKRTETFIKASVADADLRTDLLFYLLMAIGHPAWMRNRTAFKDWNIDAIPDEQFNECLGLVRRIYINRGATDTAAKGPEMVADLLKALDLPQRENATSKRARRKRLLEHV